MSRLIDQIKKTAKAKLDEAEFRSDDGKSTVPDVAFDKSAPKTDLDQEGEGDSKETKNSKIKSTKKDEPGGKKPEVWGDTARTVKENRDEIIIKRDEDDDEDDDDEDDDDEDLDNDDGAPDGDDDDEDEKKSPPKVTKEHLDVDSHLKALFGKETLTEEFKTKTKTIFEAAVLAASNQVVAEMFAEMQAEKEAEQDALVETMINKIDEYLDKVVSDWVEENVVAIERNVRTEIAESFLEGLKNLFDEHYINIDEDKVDVVEALVTKVEALEDSLNEEINRNIALANTLAEARKEALVAEQAEGLTVNEAEKLRLLAEGIDYEDDESFASQVSDIKEAYFKTKTVKAGDISEPDPVVLAEEKIMSDDVEGKAYADAITRLMRKIK